ncbi:MAG: YHS domain-containing (seleno)protein [Bauldia sp.]
MTFRFTSLLVAGTILASAPAFASNVNTGYFGNVAIEGYDTVAYFTARKATRGLETITYEWQGATWQFANEKDRALFAANPEAYAPQFGGLCAEGVAYHEVSANIEPEVWEVIEGKLYMNYSAAFVDLPGNIPAAQTNWPEVKAKLQK